MVKAALNGTEHNGDVAKKPTEQKHTSENSGKKQGNASEKDVNKVKVEAEVTVTSIKDFIAKGSKKLMDAEKNKAADITNIQQRKEYLEREMEKRLTRTNPLGKDMDYNRYWYFRKDARIFVESFDHKQWGCNATKPKLDALMGSLNEKGEREKALKKQLEKRYNKISGEMQKKSKEAQRIQMEEEAALRRSSRIRALPRENPARAFLKYVNKLKEDLTSNK